MPPKGVSHRTVVVDQGFNDNYLNGQLDDVRFYSRELTASEASLLAAVPPEDAEYTTWYVLSQGGHSKAME